MATKNLTASDKKKMLTDAIILCYQVGEYNQALVGNPLSYYDFDEVFFLIERLNNDNMEQGGGDLFEGAKRYFGYKTYR